MRKTIFFIFLFFVIYNCGTIEEKATLSKDDQLVLAAKEIKDVPVFSPKQSLQKISIEKGFVISLVASEPLISSPVTFAFDDDFRMWVVEMNSFQPVMDENTGPLPKGRVVILEDTNGDGVMDKRSVFLDSLDVPRSIYIDDEGILVASPPNLWYYYRDGIIVKNRILVDSTYTITNNTEGQTNGLYRSMDNWIYNAGFGSSKRYRKVKGEWIIESTVNRGQWGLSQDDFGRLFYNSNSNQLIGDYFMPGLVSRNQRQWRVEGYNHTIVRNQRVYPIRVTHGANNAFREGELDGNLKLARFTAASGPVIYRGGIFGDEFEGNAFVAEPVGNLVKRNIIKYNEFEIEGEQAYDDREFIASTDERFRPVTLKNGPDGGLYIVDMYRGVIQDSMWVSPYLREYSINHNLVDPINLGRIYKILPKTNIKENMIVERIPSDSDSIIKLFFSKNGWIRDKAQQKLIDHNHIEAIDQLKEMVEDVNVDILPRIHALWTLEGLNAIDKEYIELLFDIHEDILFRKQLINVFKELIDGNHKKYLSTIKDIAMSNNEIELAPNIIYLINQYRDFDIDFIKEIYGIYLKKFDNKYVIDAIINGFGKNIETYKSLTDYSEIFKEKYEILMKNQQGNNLAETRFRRGFELYKTYCGICHGETGKGIEFTAPPLDNSEIVTGNSDILIALTLNGIEGDIMIDGVLYNKSNTGADMPAFKSILNDSEAAQIINFIRNAWNNEGSRINSNDISTVRYLTIDRKENSAFTIEELNELFEE